MRRTRKKQRAVVRRISVKLGVSAAIAALCAFSMAAGALAQAVEPQLHGQELLDALRKGGLVILMRHMSTDNFVPDDGTHIDTKCATQRNLDERGEAEAKAVGQAFQTLGIPIGAVLSSPYCRCVETGMLAFGKVVQVEELAVFDELSGPEKDERGKMIRSMLNDAPGAGYNNVLITHTGTLLYTFGLKTQPEGIAHVFRPAEFGQAIYVGRVTPAEWSQFASSAPPAS